MTPNLTPGGDLVDNFVDVFGFGHCCIDYLSVIDPYPEKGKKSDVIESLTIGGGPVPTALATVAKFGGTARFCGKVGTDHEGDIIIKGLKDHNVDTQWMIRDSQISTARANIWIDPIDGARTIALDTTRYKWMTPDQLDERLFANCRIVLCDGRSPDVMMKGLNLAKIYNVPTVLDVGTSRTRLDEMLPLIDYAVVSIDLSDSLCRGGTPEQLVDKLITMGSRIGVVTAGIKGTFWDDGTRCGHVPAFPTEIVDTTGAGDVFHGAFVYGLLKEWELEEIIRFSNAAAALSCRKLSGLLSIPSIDEVMTLVS